MEIPVNPITQSIFNAGKYSFIALSIFTVGGLLGHSMECVTLPNGEARGSAYCGHTHNEPRVPYLPDKPSMTSASTIPPGLGTQNGSVVMVDSLELFRVRPSGVIFHINNKTS